MKCKRVLEICIDAKTTVYEKFLVRRHLAGCEGCRREAEFLQETQCKLEKGFHASQADTPDMIDTIMAALPEKPLHHDRVIHWKPAALGACIILVVICAGLFYKPHPPINKRLMARQTPVRKPAQSIATVELPDMHQNHTVHIPVDNKKTPGIKAACKQRVVSSRIIAVHQKKAGTLRKESQTIEHTSGGNSIETAPEIDRPCAQSSHPVADVQEPIELMVMNIHQIQDEPETDEQP